MSGMLKWEGYLITQITQLLWQILDGEKVIEKNKVTKNWEMKIKDLIKFLKAYDKFINAINNVLGNHITSIESIDLVGHRGTQIPWLNGKI